MKLRNDAEVRKVCDELDDEAAVQARLDAGFFNDNPMPAQEWLRKRQHKRDLDAMRYTRWTAIASIAMAVITLLALGWQSHDSRQQRDIAKAALEAQHNDSEAQRKDAKELLRVQIAVELDKQFDSPEMRGARRRLARQILKHQEVTETRILDFFESLNDYLDSDDIDKDTVYGSYSYYIERYWPALHLYVDALRKEENDTDYYGGFEGLNKQMLEENARRTKKKVNQVTPREIEVHRFLQEESTLER